MSRFAPVARRCSRLGTPTAIMGSGPRLPFSSAGSPRSRALARRGDPVTINGPRWRWNQLLIAFDLGCEELGKSFDLKPEKPAADREHAAIRDLLRKPA